MSISFAGVPQIQIQFDGALDRSCSFVDNDDVIDSLQSTLQVLTNINETEAACQNLLVNSRAFIDSSLNEAINRQELLTKAKSNNKILTDLIASMNQSSSGYDGSYDGLLLTSNQEMANLQNKEILKQKSLSQTLQLGATLFKDLSNSPVQCSHSFGQDLLAPAISVTGQVFSAANPAVGLVADLLSSIINYASRVLDPSYISYRKLTAASNFHLTYKCAAKNIEDILCNLEEQEDTSASTSDSELYNLRLRYKDQIAAYDTENEDFKKFHHLKRHRYRFSKILEDLDNIYRSPETAQDIEAIVSRQTGFTALSLIARLNPLRNEEYLRLLRAEGLGSPSLQSDWSVWDRTQVNFRNWMFNFGRGFFRDRINALCAGIPNTDPDLGNIYNSNGDECNYSRLTSNKNITKFINIAVFPALVQVQVELKERNDKVQNNPNIHALFDYIRSQTENTGDQDIKEYTLKELTNLYDEHATGNLNSSLQLYAEDVQAIVKSIAFLVNPEENDTENLAPCVDAIPEDTTSGDTPLNYMTRTPYISEDATSFDKFVEATKCAYTAIAKVSNNGVSGSILYRAIIESKMSAYLDGVRNNYIFNKDEVLAQNFSQYEFNFNRYENLGSIGNKPDSSGSANITLMNSVKDGFKRTFSRVISRILNETRKKYQSGQSYLKRDLIHSCAIFYPWLDKSFKGQTKRMKRFCQTLITKNNGIQFFTNSPEKFPLTTEEGLNFKNRCYYKRYEDAVIIHQINKAQRNRGRFRI
jgi:hypothetical protein